MGGYIIWSSSTRCALPSPSQQRPGRCLLARPRVFPLCAPWSGRCYLPSLGAAAGFQALVFFFFIPSLLSRHVLFSRPPSPPPLQRPVAMSSSLDRPPSIGTDDSDAGSSAGEARLRSSSSRSPPLAGTTPAWAAATAAADAAEMARLASELASLRDGEAAAAAALSASAARERRAAAAVAAQQVRVRGRGRGGRGMWGGVGRMPVGARGVPRRLRVGALAVAGASTHPVGIFYAGTPSGSDSVAALGLGTVCC